jgi:hypothetical protein
MHQCAHAKQATTGTPCQRVLCANASPTLPPPLTHTQLISSFLQYLWRFSEAVFPQPLHLGFLFFVSLVYLSPLFRSQLPALEALRLGCTAFQIASIGLGACAHLFSSATGGHARWSCLRVCMCVCVCVCEVSVVVHMTATWTEP